MHGIVKHLRSLDRRTRLTILWGITLAALAGLYLEPRVPLAPGYHEFADQRILGGFPRAFDVLSNAAFLVFGTWGLLSLREPRSRVSFAEEQERLPYVLFFAGVALTGIGSAYYHLQPGDARLPWDLLPMTMSFMSLLAATIMERISLRAGLLFFLPTLVVCGFASVAYWQLGAWRGQGDYRFYMFTQYFAAIAIGAIVVLFPPRYTRTTYGLFLAFLFYALAKIFELWDREIFSLGGIVSGHTLKHLSAGVACYCILRMVQLRKVTRFPDLASNSLEAASIERTSG